MNIPPPLCELNCLYDEALQWTKTKLDRAGLRVIQTFNLNTVRDRSMECPCPHHDTDVCDCQMAVLLVYGSEKAPATLTLHGNNGQTWISVVDTSHNEIAAAELLAKIRTTLEKKSDFSAYAG